MNFIEELNNNPSCLDIIVLEDEPFLAEDLSDEISSKVESENTKTMIIDSLREVESKVESAQGDLILVADLVVDLKPGSTEKTDAQSLLRKFKQEGKFIPVVTHTAYEGKAEAVKRNGLANFTIIKSKNSNFAVVEKVSELEKEVVNFRKEILYGFISLYKAAQSEELFEKQNHLTECRNILGTLELSLNFPDDYRRFFRWFVSFIMRLSSIKSPELGIHSIGSDLPEHLERIRKAFERTDFNYSKNALPVMATLESLGYPVLLRTQY